ncbi:hypothetical protein LI139_05020 [Veillonella atypica]|uniref:hypothetical protein n=1 Tax=Veillonella atypica TaxID=39777 RepID=UPI001D08F13A|nr:hypothetical protein [Veillonella atypica]MCB6515007.1 hypothetical protein [Veillonella atypica]MCG4862581.1 hypothetical protein [Veillonella atypica]
MIDFELLSGALTIVSGNDIYKPIIEHGVGGIFARYCINGINIEMMISMFDLRKGRISLEEYTSLVRKRALFEYMNLVENARKEEWNNALKDWKEKQEDNKC